MKLYKKDSKNIKLIKPANINVAVYGLGKMGLPLAAVFAYKGFNVVGVDTNYRVVKKINQGINPILGEKNLSKFIKEVVAKNRLIATTNGIEASQKTDIKIIIVPTFLISKKPDLNIVKSVVETIAQGLQKGDIVILESTAPPGTTINVIAKILEKNSGLKLNKDFAVAHCPERTNSGTAIADIMGRINPKIVGASDLKALSVVKYIYKLINSRGVVDVKNTKIAEMVKISEMVYRDVKIAYANSLALICDQLNIEAKDVIEAANTDAGCHILNPGPGVGGHCIPVYPYFIFSKVKRDIDLLKAVRKINDKMPDYVIGLIKEALKEKGRNITNSNILILGFSYRGDVKETRLSPGIEIYKKLFSKTKNVFVFDPLFTRVETLKYGMNYRKSFEKIDCVVIAAEHQKFKKLNWNNIAKKLRTKVVVDTKQLINFNKLKKLNFSIRRIGYRD